MPKVNPDILRWARETEGLSPDEAVRRIGLKEARGVLSTDRLENIESGIEEPTRSLLTRMAKKYHRPLLTFYLSQPPRIGDRGQDFRTLPEVYSHDDEVVLDVLLREIMARQSMLRAAIEDEDEVEPIRFIGTGSTKDGVTALVDSIRTQLEMSITDFRAEKTSEDAFSLLRNHVAQLGVFIILQGDLGSYHTAIDVETFRGFALADEIAPFIVINDQDSRAAWSFTLLHELAHLWLGQTGVSGAYAGKSIERFCNDVASEFLLPSEEFGQFKMPDIETLDEIQTHIFQWASQRNISSAMVAYRLFRADVIDSDTWFQLRVAFHQKWAELRLRQREIHRERAKPGGPTYYTLRRHRIGSPLLNVVQRMMMSGTLTTIKAGKVLGVKPTLVQTLLETSRWA